MMNGLVIKRGAEYAARKMKNVRTDEAGLCWTEDIQKARVFLDHEHACRAARRCGGTVLSMKDGRVQE